MEQKVKEWERDASAGGADGQVKKERWAGGQLPLLTAYALGSKHLQM